MKKIIVFGAAGRTGKYVVQYALDAGHEVAAFIRHSSLSIQHPNLSIITGDIYEEQKISDAISGKDVVISTLGTKNIEGPEVNLMGDAMKLFLKAMKQHQVKRVLAVGGLAVLQFNDTMQLLDKPDYPVQYRNVGQGHNGVYRLMEASETDWTFIACPDIIAHPRTGNYRTNKNYPAKGLFKINTGDLADFIVKEIAENRFTKTRVGICNY